MWVAFILAWLNSIFMATGDARPLDLAELLLYNTGNAAPPARLIYAATESTVWVSFFATSEQHLRVGDALLRVSQRTGYPYDGDIEVRIEPEGRAIFTVAIRIPAWARGELTWSDRHRFEYPDVSAWTVIVNGETVRLGFDRGFAKVRREWRSGDVIHVYFPMPIHRVQPRDTSCNAVQRGPLISCSR